MREDKPAWYERAGKGPFVREAFDEKMRETIERRVAGKRERAKRGMAAFALAGTAATLLAVLLLTRYQSHWFAPSEVNVPTIDNPVTSSPPETASAVVVRAEGVSKSGRLLVVPVGEEMQEHLGASSCIGTETDTRFEGDYRVVYVGADGSERIVAELPALTFVQPSAKKFQMMKLTFAEATVFVLAPQYTDCRAISFYAYAVDESGQAFPLTFRTEDGTIADSSYYPPDRIPSVRGGQLVLPSSEGPGGETAAGPQDRTFTLDLAAKALIQTSSDGRATNTGKNSS
ncbi:hypothetical protein ACFSR7_33615 [Cohnella sp. GCM10020058]|uniref:hypothetical protein n=1 Tax=Cohnella sp. GCM10020058 TaxID=3317330 RepID=UPI00363407E3